MKKFLATTLILALALALCFSFAACDKSQQIKDFTEIDYSTLLKDYLAAPDTANNTKMEAVSRNVSDIYDDDSLTDAQKIAEIMDRVTLNEIECDHFAFFRNQLGETKIKNKSGKLIYQRLRKQSDDIKDDTTIKLPVNHNFGAIEAKFVTNANIRYVNNNKYNRMNNKSKITYNTKTGLLEVSQWKKQSSDNWNQTQSAKVSRSYPEANKTSVYWKSENAGNFINSEDIKLEKNDDFYTITFSIDVSVVNKDKDTIDSLNEANGGKDMQYNYCNITVEIWNNGLAKRYIIEEKWTGQIGEKSLNIWYSGSASSKSEIVYSYSERDMDYSKTDAIYKKIAKK